MDSVFFKEFLMISTYETIGFIALLVAVIFGMNKLPKKKFSFSARVMIGTVLGLIIGLIIQAVSGFNSDPMSVTFVKETTKWYSLLGGGFISLIRMLVIPLVMVSIIHVVINMKEGINLGALVKRTIVVFMITVAISVGVGIALGLIFNLGADGSVKITGEAAKIKEVTNIVDTLRNLIPANPVDAMVKLNIVGLVIFSSFIAMGAKKMSVKYMDIIKPFYDIINASHKIIISMAMSIIRWMPIAVIPMLANTIAQRGINAILEVGKFIGLIYLASLVVLILQLITLSIFGLNPITFVKKSFSLWVMAFTSRSSVGCLPFTISTLNGKLGVNESTASFVGSFGTTAGMQGCAGLFPGLLVVFVANQAGVPIDISFVVMAIVVISIGSLGIAGIPGTATMAASVALSGTGLGASFGLISPIIAIDPIIDMARTMLNVTGACVNALVVDKTLGTIDLNAYNDMSLAEQVENTDNA